MSGTKKSSTDFLPANVLGDASCSSAIPRSSRANPISFADIAFGVLAPRLEHRPCQSCIGNGLALLRHAQHTWVPHAGPAEVLILADCKNATELPMWRVLTAGSKQARLDLLCFTEHVAHGRTLWRKTAFLLRALWKRYPRKLFYIKLDIDTLVSPAPLLSLLAAMHARRGRAAYYFGNGVGGPSPSKNTTLCLLPHCLFNSPEWFRVSAYASTSRSGSTGSYFAAGSGGAVVDAAGGTAADAAFSVSYASGGLYGFSAAAMRHVGAGHCLARVVSAANDFLARRHNGSPPPAEPIFEDTAVGLCMHLHRVPLQSCECFHSIHWTRLWALCSPSTKRPQDTLKGRAGKPNCANQVPCRHPISIHPLKFGRVYPAWWRWLQAREGYPPRATLGYSNRVVPHARL